MRPSTASPAAPSDRPVPRRSWRLKRATDASSWKNRVAGSNSKNTSMLVAIEPAIAISVGPSPRSLWAMNPPSRVFAYRVSGTSTSARRQAAAIADGDHVDARQRSEAQGSSPETSTAV